MAKHNTTCKEFNLRPKSSNIEIINEHGNLFVIELASAQMVKRLGKLLCNANLLSDVVCLFLACVHFSVAL